MARAKAKAKPRPKAKRAKPGLDLQADIIPGTSAAGVAIWQPIAEVLAIAKPMRTETLSSDMKAYTFEGVKLWATGDLVTQIGLVAGYRGTLEPKVRVGAGVSALEEIGEVEVDSEDNTVVAGLAGIVFDLDGSTIRGIYVTALGEFEDTDEDE